MMNRREFIGSGLVGLSLPTSSSIAAPASPRKSSEANALVWPKGKAAALCIGVSSYAELNSLRTPQSDAHLLAQLFFDLGFETRVLMNPKHEDFLLGLAKFRLLARQTDLAVIYVAGHGGFIGDDVMVFPSDMSSDLERVRKAIPESVMVKTLSDEPRNKILLLDCCNTHIPVLMSRRIKRASVGGLFSFYAAQPGSPAYDGSKRVGPFASALNEAMLGNAGEIEDIARTARRRVVQLTDGVQIPWSKSSLLNRVTLSREAA